MEILNEIQDSVILYANILSQILKLDVTVVNSQLIRIAGTGRLAAEINSSMYGESLIFQTVLKTKKLQVIDQPGIDPVCGPCDHKETCKERFHMSAPIMEQGKAVGVIGFLCYTKKQRDHAIRNRQVFMELLQQFADLISLKAAEAVKNREDRGMRELLETVIDRMDAGVIVFDQNLQVLQVNLTCCQILQLTEKELFTQLTGVEKTGNVISDLNEYILSTQNRRYVLTGKLFDLKINDGSKLFLFQQADRKPARSLGISSGKNYGISRIEGTSPSVLKIQQEILRIAASPSCVLITGDTGTEQAAAAAAIHEESSRSEELLITVNCEAASEDTLEAELFGIARTSSRKGSTGKIESCAKGTLILEEVSHLPYSLQLRISQFLENRMLVRKGGTKGVHMNTRLIFTSSEDLTALTRQGRFLQSLFYRISALTIHMPSLKERTGDLPQLSQKYLYQNAREMNRTIEEIRPDFYNALASYSWPGNLWELRSVMEYALNMMPAEGIISSALLPEHIRSLAETDMDLNLDHMEEKLLKQALSRYSTSVEGKTKAAAALGISLPTLYRKLKRYGLD